MKITVASQGPDITAAAALDHQPPPFWIVYDTITHTYEVLDGDHVSRSSVGPVLFSDPDHPSPEWDRPVRLPELTSRKQSNLSVGDVIDLVSHRNTFCPV
ncbi:hypothetical protein KQH82_06690 [bacterium]|nr:hypothetical protein [bacterium]